MDKWRACGEEITHQLCYLYQVCMCTHCTVYQTGTFFRDQFFPILGPVLFSGTIQKGAKFPGPGCHTVCRKMVKRQKILSREFISFGLEPDFIFLVKGSA